MEPMLIDLKTEKKGIIRTILDDHRDLAIHKHALIEMLLLLTSTDSNSVISTYEDPIIDAVFSEIEKLKSRFQQLDDSKDYIDDGGDNAPNP